VSWEISLHPEVESWYLAICASDPETADLIKDAIDQLATRRATGSAGIAKQSRWRMNASPST
jgi:hypothetical protein